MSDTRERLQAIFHELFDDSTLVLTDQTTAQDVEGWDSLAHINLIIAVEKQFGIRFATAEISRLKDAGQDVGAFIWLIETKRGNR